MATAEKQIAVENLGPIENLTVRLNNHGVTVLSGSNGTGKSTLLDASAKLAGGSGKVPLRDHARKGRVEGFGAAISIGHASRHNGEFEVASLEGRFDLAELVDPKLKSPTAADKRRIKALVGLTGVEADLSLFEQHEAFADLMSVVPAGVDECSDLVEMASQVKRAYEAESRRAEKQADRAFGEARAMEQVAGEYDETLATLDPEVLQDDLQEAIVDETQLKERADAYERAGAKHTAASLRLAEIEASYDGRTVEEAEKALQQSAAAIDANNDDIARIQRQLDEATQKGHRLQACYEQAESAHRDAHRHAETVANCQAILDGSLPEPIGDVEVMAASQAVTDAREKVEAAAVARSAAKRSDEAASHKQAGLRYRKRSEALREAARSTDEVLSAAIDCGELRVESAGGEARLVVDHQKRGNGIPYHELSEGERWAIAIKLGADQVGRDGVLVCPQEAWESLDVWTREQVNAAAIANGVYILTAEATRDKADGKDLLVKEYVTDGA